MLAGKYRMRGHYYISRAKEKGTMYQFPNFGMAVYKRKDDDKPPKFSFIVSTKIAKHAVDRNRIKRTLSEAVRFESKYLINGYDVVFLAKTQITRTPTDDTMKEVKQALKKAKLI
ncbi:ribonuclease P protein component [Candidatus Woesebacteria bacterium]|nr:MAG: ribonuclease P protein component [Candidatus Woesebacteria bacterium]